MEEPQHHLHMGLKTHLLIDDEEEEEEFIAKPNCFSFSSTDPAESSSPKIKQKSLLKMKKLLVPKKGSKLKSKAKQVISQECGKSSNKKRRTRAEDLYNNDEEKHSVMERLEEVLESIGDNCPSFVKCMLPSNVSHGFWMFFPKKFCSSYLPKHDSTIFLVGECGKEYEAKYLVDRHGLSGGWRGFSLSQRILKGDIVVFQLIKPCTLKIHIVRVNGLEEIDAALCLMSLVDHTKRTILGTKMRTKKNAKKSVKPLDQAKTLESDNFGSEVLEGSEISEECSKESRVNSKPRKTCSSFQAHKVTSSPALKVAK